MLFFSCSVYDSTAEIFRPLPRGLRVTNASKTPRQDKDTRCYSILKLHRPQHSLGPRFTLSPAKHTGNRFVPYSIEPACSSLPFTPTSERLDRIYLLAKEVRYFATEKYDFAWDLPRMAEIASAEGITFVGGFKVGDEHQEEREKLMQEVLDAGVQNLGTLGREAFYQELSKSRALMGLSFPKLSPSPWDGLCMGLPVSGSQSFLAVR